MTIRENTVNVHQRVWFALLAILSCVLATPAVAAGSNWADIAKWPDFTTGVWGEKMQFGPNGAASQTALTPQATEKLKQSREAAASAGGSVPCKPPGMPGMMMQGYATGFFYTKGSIFIMTDMDNLWVRRVFMDKTTHGDPDPSWQGHSIGHWEADTLVIDTTAIYEEAPLAGVPSGGQTHVVERIRLVGPDQLDWRMTVTNPEVLVKPMQLTKTYFRHKDWEIQDAWCGEGNRDAPDANGNASVDLTPPK